MTINCDSSNYTSITLRYNNQLYDLTLNGGNLELVKVTNSLNAVIDINPDHDNVINYNEERAYAIVVDSSNELTLQDA